MFKNIEQIFKTLILINSFISVVITLKIFIKNNYTFSEMSTGLLITIIYGSIWFYSLYKIYNFSNNLGCLRVAYLLGLPVLDCA